MPSVSFKAYGLKLWATYTKHDPTDLEIIEITTDNGSENISEIVSQAVMNLAQAAIEQDDRDLDEYHQQTALEMRHPDY